MMHNVYISIGSNLGDSLTTIKSAISQLKSFCSEVKVSSFYRTKPVLYLDQADFINAMIYIQTKLEPYELLAKLQEIELLYKRQRIIRYGPRTLDLDIILFDDLIITEDKLCIPHARMHERAFVLVPLCELNANLYISKYQKNVTELKNMLSYNELAGVIKL